MSNPSTFNPIVIQDRLKGDRLKSYLEDCNDNLDWALDLYFRMAGLSRVPAVLASRPG